MATSDIADVLIIGSGASGGPFAWSLSKVPGIKVVCLEQGDWVAKPSDNPKAEADGQRQRLVSPPPREGVRHFTDGYPYDHSESYWQPILGNAVGGAMVHYGAVWARLLPSDFVAGSLSGVGDDWPIRYWDLAPYYDFNDRMVGVSGVAGNPAYPPKPVDLMPTLKVSKAGEILSHGFDRLGWHWWPAERAVITKPHGGRAPCPQNCVSCHQGCSREAKNSSDVIHWPEAIENGVVLKTRARVREVIVNKQGLAEGALYYDADGRLNEQKARIVVVACNGIGTPRLLLNSTSAQFPHGLANSSGLVGKGLMGHPKATVVGLFEREDLTERGPTTVYLTSDQFSVDASAQDFARGFWILSGAYRGPIEIALGRPPVPLASVIPAELDLGRKPADDVAWGAAHHVAFQERFQHTAAMSMYCDELPEDANRVELHPTLTDDAGIPAPKLVYRRGENTQKMLDFGMERCKEVMEAAGATKILSAEKVPPAPGHYLGTARMGNDPEKSVVDKWGRAHDVSNLFIIDGSVFTTAGGCVPTSTIQAIALRTADYFKNNARQLLQ
jgi:choline dehydrogenase-like flavoprotein